MTCDACGSADVAWCGYPREHGLPKRKTDLCAQCRHD